MHNAHCIIDNALSSLNITAGGVPMLLSYPNWKELVQEKTYLNKRGQAFVMNSKCCQKYVFKNSLDVEGKPTDANITSSLPSGLCGHHMHKIDPTRIQRSAMESASLPKNE